VKQSAPESTGGIRQIEELTVEKRKALQQTALEPSEEIDRITERIQKSLNSEDVHLSVADLMRLLEIRGELTQPQTAPLTVRWIGECQHTSDE
jgi:hypothetical protein